MSQSLATNPAPGFDTHPGYAVDIEPCGKHVTVELNGETIVDSKNAVLVMESRHAPVLYFPQNEVRMDLTKKTDLSTHCPFKGDASYWSITVGDRTEENSIWGYEAPFDECLTIKDYVSFYWDKMDAWYEDGVQVEAPSDPRNA